MAWIQPTELLYLVHWATDWSPEVGGIGMASGLPQNPGLWALVDIAIIGRKMNGSRHSPSCPLVTLPIATAAAPASWLWVPVSAAIVCAAWESVPYASSSKPAPLCTPCWSQSWCRMSHALHCCCMSHALWWSPNQYPMPHALCHLCVSWVRA